MQQIRDGEGNMVILQETWSDETASVMVYAPVDMPCIDMLMSGGDPDGVAILPSGFVVQPTGGLYHENYNNGIGDGTEGGDQCLFTVCFQILVSSIPSTKLTVEIVDTVNKLMIVMMDRIKEALLMA